MRDYSKGRQPSRLQNQPRLYMIPRRVSRRRRSVVILRVLRSRPRLPLLSQPSPRQSVRGQGKRPREMPLSGVSFVSSTSELLRTSSVPVKIISSFRTRQYRRFKKGSVLFCTVTHPAKTSPRLWVWSVRDRRACCCRLRVSALLDSRFFWMASCRDRHSCLSKDSRSHFSFAALLFCSIIRRLSASSLSSDSAFLLLAIAARRRSSCS